MTQGFQKVNNICILMQIYMKIGWRPLQVHDTCNIKNNNNNKHSTIYMLLNCKWREWQHNLLLKSLDQQNYKYHLLDQNLQKDSHLNLNWGEEWCRSWDHLQKDLKILQHIQIHQNVWRR